MRKGLFIAGLLVVLIGVVAVPQASLNIAPRTILKMGDGVVYLFDNETGATQSTIVLVFSGSVSLQPTDVLAIGGDAAVIRLWGGGALVAIDVNVLAGGTVEIALTGDNAGGSIEQAWWSQN